MLVAMTISMLGLGFVSCGDDDNGSNGGSKGQRLWYVHVKHTHDTDPNGYYEYIYDYYDDGRVKTLSWGSDLDAKPVIYYEYTPTDIIATTNSGGDGSAGIINVCHLESGRITSIDYAVNGRSYFYTFRYDSQGHLVEVCYNNAGHESFIYIEWNGDEVASYSSNYGGSKYFQYAYEPSTTVNNRCDGQFSPLIDALEGFIWNDGLTLRIIHPLEKYFGTKPAHLMGKRIMYNSDGKTVFTTDYFTYNLSGGYVESVDYTKYRKYLEDSDTHVEDIGRYRTLGWR